MGILYSNARTLTFLNNIYSETYRSSACANNIQKYKYGIISLNSYEFNNGNVLYIYFNFYNIKDVIIHNDEVQNNYAKCKYYSE